MRSRYVGREFPNKADNKEFMDIYCLVNKENCKMYVGQTSVGVENRWKRHIWDSQQKKTQSYPLYRAIRKYGINSFDFIHLGTATTQENLDNLERLWIILLQTRNDEYGYNIREGGHRGKNSSETRRKISLSNMGRKGWNKGVPMRPETKEKLVHTFFKPGHKGCVGRVLSEETKAKIGITSVGRWLGRKHSEESKRKMADARRKWHAEQGHVVSL